MRGLPTLEPFWPRISGPVQSRTRMGVRGDLLNPVVRNWNETGMPPSLLLATVGLSGVRSLSQMKRVQVSPAVGLTSLPLRLDISVLAAEVTYVCVYQTQQGWVPVLLPCDTRNDPEFLCSLHTSISSKSWEPLNEPSRLRHQN